MSAQDFKSCGPDYIGTVGSIPTHFRQFSPDGFGLATKVLSMSSRKPRKPKPFRAATEVKRRARSEIGSPPPVRRHASRKGRPPKHKKQLSEEIAESL